MKLTEDIKKYADKGELEFLKEYEDEYGGYRKPVDDFEMDEDEASEMVAADQGSDELGDEEYFDDEGEEEVESWRTHLSALRDAIEDAIESGDDTLVQDIKAAIGELVADDTGESVPTPEEGAAELEPEEMV